VAILANATKKLTFANKTHCEKYILYKFCHQILEIATENEKVIANPA
jgi:hypothetical protein